MASNATCDFVPSRLQSNETLGFLLKYFFDELEVYYPCIDRADFYQRLSTLFDRHCSYQGSTTWISKKPENLCLAALTCTILALATYLSGGSASNELQAAEDCTAAASEWHQESRKLLAEYAWDDEPSLDVLRLHILEVLYYTMLEKSRAMSMARAVAVELAFALELNNEAAWGQLTYRQTEYRRMLWWMVYIIDRRISIRTDRPYLINDTEFAVKDFTSQSRMCYLSQPLFDLGYNQSDATFGVHQWPQPSEPTEDWFAYLQFNTRWSRIATRVWDNCCSLGIARSVDVEGISALDVLLVNLESSLAPILLWKQESLLDLIQAGKTDRYIRLRLIMFERINMLRLFIRSCPRTSMVPLQRQSASHSSETIASDTIDSAVSYLSLRQEARPWCTYLTLLLVDASSRVAPIVKRQAANPSMGAYRVILSMIHAQDCLRDLAKCKLSITWKAQARLNEILDDVNVTCTLAMSIPGVIDTSGDAVARRIDKPVVTGLLPMEDWRFDTSEIWHAGELADLLSSDAFPLDFDRW